MNDPTMSPTIYFTTLSMLLGTVLIVFGLRYVAQMKQSETSAAREEAYRVLAEKSTAVLTAVQAELAEVKTRLAAVETMLKTVE